MLRLNYALALGLSSIQSPLIATFGAYKEISSNIRVTFDEQQRAVDDFLPEVETAIATGIAEIQKVNNISDANIETWRQEISDWELEVAVQYGSYSVSDSQELVSLLHSMHQCLKSVRKSDSYFTNSSTCIEATDRLTSDFEDTIVDLTSSKEVVFPVLKLSEPSVVTLDESLATRVNQQFERGLDRTRQQMESTTSSLQLMADGLVEAGPSVSSLQALIDILEASQVRFDNSVRQFNKVQSSIAAQDWFSFTKATVLRIGVIVLMIFLVQILVNLFRYSTRLAAFYNARADVLELAIIDGRQMGVSELAEFIRAMSPDNLDFGKPVRSPVDQAVEISRNLAASSKTRA